MAGISVVSLSSLAAGHRIGAEFYHPAKLSSLKRLSANCISLVGDAFSVVRQTVSPKLCGVEEAIVFDLTDVSNGLMGEGQRITDLCELGSTKKRFKTHDVLISRLRPYLKEVCLVSKEETMLLGSTEFIVLRQKKDFTPACLVAFLLTKEVQNILFWSQEGTNHPRFPEDVLLDLPLPQIDTVRQKEISGLVSGAVAQIDRSRILYNHAQQAVLDEVDFLEPDLPKRLFYEATKDEVASTNRLDAEYYRPLFRLAAEKVEAIAEQTIEFGKLCDTLTNGHTPLRHPLDQGDVIFLTAEHIDDFRVYFNSDKRILSEHHGGELRRTALRNGDVLVTIKGKVGNAAVITDLARPTNINQDVALIRLKPGIDPDYLCSFINSPLGKLLSARMSTNQINPFLGLGNLAKIPIPMIDDKRMTRVGASVRAILADARHAQEKARKLIEISKQLVEDYIENAR